MLQKVWNINADSTNISKLVKTKTNFMYFTGYLDKVVRPLVFIMPKINAYATIFTVKDGDKNKNNKLMSFHIDDEKLLEKFKAIWTKIEYLKVLN